MSQDKREQSPERTQQSEESDEKNVKKEKTKKTVKEENTKKVNECHRKLSEICPPKIRKILHKMMSRYYNDPFYDTNDIAKKILKSLRVNNTSYFMTRIKKNMEKWISDNVFDDDSTDTDSSDESNNNESKDAQKEEKKIGTKTTKKVKDKPSNVNIVEVDLPPDDDQVQASKSDKKTVINANIVKLEKVIPVIDLTLDFKQEVKDEITIIDDDIPDNSNKVFDTPVNGAPIQPCMQQTPLAPGYNQTVPVPIYQPVYPNFDPNLYNPYFMPYGYQYLHNPYYYYPSDFLSNYPVDETGNANTKVTNESYPTDTNVSNPKDIDAGVSQTVEGS